MASEDKIIFYTNHSCPWAHRAQIALAELDIPYEEVLIDLDTPRTPEYLAINPRGQVPTLSFNGEIIYESAIIAQFLADKQPNHLIPPTGTAAGALRRARISLFVETLMSTASSQFFKLPFKVGAELDEASRAVAANLIKDVEPLLADAKPFFGGSEKITFAEVLTGPFILRVFTLSRAGVFPEIIAQELAEKAPNLTKWAEEMDRHPSIVKNYDHKSIAETAREKIAQVRASLPA